MPKPQPRLKQQGKGYTAEERDEIFKSLEYYFKLAYNRKQACDFIGFSPKTLSAWEKKDKSLTIRINSLINKVNEKARSVIIGKLNKGDDSTARWWLERMEKDAFSTKQEVETDHTGEVKVIDVSPRIDRP